MTFEEELLALIGDADDAFDMRASVRRCFLYDFEGSPVRIWDGEGKLIAGGFDWLGTIEKGVNYHKAPAVKDTRDGVSPRYNFELPYLSRDLYEEIKAEKDKAKGRNLTCYHALVKEGEGMRPNTPLRFAYRLTMQDVNFKEGTSGGPANMQMIYSASVTARSGEVGRSRTPAGTMTDTSQRERARLLGYPSDSFCSMVSANANRTMTIEGT